MTSIQHFAEKEQDALNNLKGQLKAIFNDLEKNHKNTAVKPLNEKGNVYTIQSSEVFSRDNWNPSFHNFQEQYKLILQKLENCSSVNEFSNFINNCVGNGYIEINKQRTKIHPQVMDKLKSLA